MIVTDICPHTKNKYRIFLDEEFAFVLYKGELRRYGIEKGEEVSEETYQELINEVLLKRAKTRAMYLLKSMDRTKQQLEEKLRQNGYPKEVICQAVSYVESYHYIDDTQYTSRYIEAKKSTKSTRQIQMELVRKGISKEQIEEAYAEKEIDEIPLIRKLIEKKRIDLNTATREELAKLYQYLMRKGFKYDDIQEALRS